MRRMTRTMDKNERNKAMQKQAYACLAAFKFARDNEPKAAEKLYTSLPATLKRRLDEAFPEEGDTDGIPERNTPDDGDTEED
jgi:hypothetical protein